MKNPPKHLSSDLLPRTYKPSENNSWVTWVFQEKEF